MSAYLAHAPRWLRVRCCAGGISLAHSHGCGADGDRPDHRCRHRRHRGHPARRYREREGRRHRRHAHRGHRLRGPVCVFANLPPAPYEITTELAGFNPGNAKVTVSVGGAFSVPIKMDVAGTKENVNVVAEVPRINTTNGEVSTTITETQIRELPTITRNVYDLVAVAGNVSGGKVADGEEWTATTRGTGYNINGQRASSTNILLDGSANNNEFDTTVGQNVPLDSVQEFSVVTSNFSAQYGRATGGIVNVLTKSGTNNFRGTGYEFYRSDKLATNTFDNKANDIEKGEFTRHQMGFSIGGPIQPRQDALLLEPRIHPRPQRRHGDHRWVPTPQFIAASAAATQAPSPRMAAA